MVDASIGRVLAEIDAQGAKNLYGYCNTTQFVAAAERMTPRDAKKLVDRATATNPGRRLDGSDEPPVAPLTGVVAAEGVLGAGHIDAIVGVMSKIPSDVTDEDRAEAEEILVVNLARKASADRGQQGGTEHPRPAGS
jgi:hypothetical protein